jgi:hypothetical protein
MPGVIAWFAALFSLCALLLLPSVGFAAPDGGGGTSHDGQIGLRVGAAFPFRVNFRYNDSPPCGVSSTSEPQNVCPVASPVALDFAVSYGITHAIEPFIWYRLGLSEEAKTRTDAVSILGAGLRIYTSGTQAFKFMLQPALAAEFEGEVGPTFGLNYGTDFIVQLLIGGQYDFMRNFGAYVALGPSVSAVRALSIGLEGALGVQGRFL